MKHNIFKKNIKKLTLSVVVLCLASNILSQTAFQMNPGNFTPVEETKIDNGDIMGQVTQTASAVGTIGEAAKAAATATKEVLGVTGSVDEKSVRSKYDRLTKSLIERGKTITTMESCTSGQVASLITDTEGASAALKGAYVTYSNEAKVAAGVPAEIIEKYGVYSAETAAAMSAACRASMKADIGVGITGSFGNADPNNADSIPGEVYFAISTDVGIECFHCTVPTQVSRLAYKLYMADVIVDRLLVS